MITNLRCERLDFVAELRLRQWARRNFVPSSERTDDDWHPIVLNEMQRKDSELTGDVPVRTVITSTGIVPLEPSRHDGIRIDQAHAVRRTPRLSRQVAGDSLIPHYG